MQIPKHIKRGDVIKADYLNNLVDYVHSITPLSSPTILVNTTTAGTSYRVISKNGPNNNNPESIEYGLTHTDYISGSTILLNPCEVNGVLLSASAVTASVPSSWGMVNLLSASVGGNDGVEVTCKIANGSMLQYAAAADGTAYLLGLPPKQVLKDWWINNTTLKVIYAVYWLFGTNASTVSEVEVSTALKSKTIDCTTGQVNGGLDVGGGSYT